jgi:hypothetical protein
MINDNLHFMGRSGVHTILISNNNGCLYVEAVASHARYVFLNELLAPLVSHRAISLEKAVVPR